MTTHLINGRWADAPRGKTFQSAVAADGNPMEKHFSEGGATEVDAAVQSARASFAEYSTLPDSARAAFLRAIAGEIDKRGDDITSVGEKETALPAARLNGERERTVNQLRMFAGFIEQGKHLDTRKDEALPDRDPLPRPDLRLLHRPCGVVGVFGASNFPLAFSVAGGDTAAALAAGCPVVVKGHPAHPHIGEIVARAIDAARTACGLPAGVFSFIQGTTPELSRSIVEHPGVDAVGFTGSLRVGRALFDIACSREVPIPFYAEMGSINPVFVFPGAAEKTDAIAQGWAQSLVLGGGQFCTNPGVLFCPASKADSFKQAAKKCLSDNAEHTLLTSGIASAYRRAMAAAEQYVFWRGSDSDGKVAATLLHCSLQEWQKNPILQEEMFGPSGVVVSYEKPEELAAVADALLGQLTATLWLSAEDHQSANALLPEIERKAGRLICNGFPTGVEVADAMMHGGPYPAATYQSTSVGSLAIRRFLRPVCYQNFPEGLLPAALR